jgi:hypothetical protein
MSTEEQTLFTIKGAISVELPETRLEIENVARQIRILVWQNKPGAGSMAVALVGAEIAAAPDGELPSPEERTPMSNVFQK